MPAHCFVCPFILSRFLFAQAWRFLFGMAWRGEARRGGAWPVSDRLLLHGVPSPHHHKLVALIFPSYLSTQASGRSKNESKGELEHNKKRHGDPESFKPLLHSRHGAHCPS